jgi:hypothetical protein
MTGDSHFLRDITFMQYGQGVLSEIRRLVVIPTPYVIARDLIGQLEMRPKHPTAYTHARKFVGLRMAIYPPDTKHRVTPSILGLTHNTELLRLYRLIVRKGEVPFFELLPDFILDAWTPAKVFLDLPPSVIHLI